MSNPTHDDQNGRPRLRLNLDNGELLEVDDSAVDDSGLPTVVLRMPPWRAFDLAHVLRAYTRMVDVVSESSEVSGTEASLSRALLDAVDVARPVQDQAPTGPAKVTSGQRLRAMAVLQAHRPELDHTTLIALVDAAARWLDEPDGDEYAYALLGAVTDQPAQSRALANLLGRSGGGV